ncbi:hypothetical protein J6590_013051 [Homalodisca vitripennis]|nr:hypothetical protein J6590_013051 [Homalodisca vitripennis]
MGRWRGSKMGRRWGGGGASSAPPLAEKMSGMDVAIIAGKMRRLGQVVGKISHTLLYLDCPPGAGPGLLTPSVLAAILTVAP